MRRRFQPPPERPLWTIADDEATPLGLLDRLADTDDRVVVIYVASNPSTSGATLARMFASTDDDMVRELILRHHSCPPHIKAMWSLAQ